MTMRLTVNLSMSCGTYNKGSQYDSYSQTEIAFVSTVRGTSKNWPRLKSELIFMPTFAERARFNTCVLYPGEGGVLNKVLHRVALPQGLTSYSLRLRIPLGFGTKKKKDLDW